MEPHNRDGSFRNTEPPSRLRPRSIIARWVEAEAVAQKLLGFSFAKIAESISRAGCGEIPSAVPKPDVTFLPDYRITPQAVQKAYQLAMTRDARLNADQMRDLDFERTENWILKLQKGIQAGDPESIRTATGLLRFRMRAHGFALEPAKKEGSNGWENLSPPDEDEAFEMEVLRCMTDEESEIVGEIMLRARQRAKDKRAGLVQTGAAG
jgi:hypothetical protein